MTNLLKTILLFGIVLSTIRLGFAQMNLQSLEFLIGNWQGVETGVAGDGIGFRTYTLELGGHYIFLENQSTFPKSEEKPMGEVHRDKAVFSYNSNIPKVMLREFHVEGFANIYELDESQSNPAKLVFVTREIENNPGNWKAKLILTKNSNEEFIEEFEIAIDGENFKPFLKNTWTRVR